MAPIGVAPTLGGGANRRCALTACHPPRRRRYLRLLRNKMDTWFFTGAADFGTGSPAGELIWGFMMYAMLVACMLGSEESSDSGSSRARRASLPLTAADAAGPMRQSLLAGAGSAAEHQQVRPNEDEDALASLLCEDLPPPRSCCAILNQRIRLASEVVGWCSLVCTLIGAVCAHIAAIDHTAWG